MIAPLPTRAQRPTVPVIGLLGGTAPAPELVAPFVEGLAEGGFSDGRDVVIHYRWANDHADRLPALAAELLRIPVAIIVTIGGTSTARAATAATTTVPVLFEVGRNPVTLGLVPSLNRPGSNATGVYMLTGELNTKRLELLHEMVPRAATIAVLINPTSSAAQADENAVREAAASAGVQSLFVRAGTPREIEAAFELLAARRVGALVVSAHPFFNNQRELLVALATRHALPAIYEWREFTASGGLMSYGTHRAAAYRQLGAYACPGSQRRKARRSACHPTDAV
jgi:putative ABC transport system substrate-binding protein